MSTRLLLFVAGAIVSAVLHAHFVRSWSMYVAPPSSEHSRFYAVSPHLTESKRAALTGAAVFMLSGVFLALTLSRMAHAVALFALGAAVIQALTYMLRPGGPGNLWPISLLAIAIVTGGPVFVGSVGASWARRKMSAEVRG